MLGKSRFELDLEWESEAVRQEHMATLLARRPFRDLLVRHRPSGQWVMVSGEPIFDARGEFTGYRGVGRDVSRQKQAERALAESGKFLDALISAIPTPVTVKDREHRYVHVNDAFCQLAGRSREELVGRDDSVILPPEEVEFVWKLDHEAVSSDKPVQYEHSYLLNGQSRWMLVRKYALPRPDGNLVVVSSLIDISNLKAVEAALRASEARLRSLLDLSADWMWEQDADHRYTYLSAEAPSKGGIEPEAALGKTLLELPFRWESEERRGAHAQDLELRRTFRDLHLMRPDPDGRTRHISVSGEPIFGARGEFLGYRGTGQDITERKLTERRIARLKDMYAAMTEANDAIIHSKDTAQLFPAICRIVVEYGHFVFARIAMIDYQTGWVPTVASAGRAQGLRGALRACPSTPSRPEGQGPRPTPSAPAATTSPTTSPATRATGPGARSSPALGVRAQATFLLHREGQVVGTLHLYADQVGFFDDELIGMLEKLAVNLSFALDNFQREEARLAAEAALRESETRFRDFADAAGEYVWEADLEGRYHLRLQPRAKRVELHRPGADRPHPVRLHAARRGRAGARMAGPERCAPDGSFRDLEHRILTRNARHPLAADQRRGHLRRRRAARRAARHRPRHHRPQDRRGAHQLPRHARSAHRAAQPRAVQRPPRAGHRRRAPQRAIAGAAVHRPGPLQEHQRLARPPGRRPAAQGGRHAHARLHPQGRHAVAPGRRRVRGDPRRPAAGRGRGPGGGQDHQGAGAPVRDRRPHAEHLLQHRHQPSSRWTPTTTAR